MAFQSVPDTFEAVVVAVFGLSRMQMTFYARTATAPYNQATAQALADDIDAWAVTGLRPNISNQVVYDHVEVRGLEFENDVFAMASAGAGAGGIGTPSLPTNVAFAVKRSSALTGRSARGRVYWFGLSEADVGGNGLSQVRGDAIVAALEDMNAAIVILGLTPVIVSRFSNLQPRPTGVTFDITGWSYTDLVVDTQRKRL